MRHTELIHGHNNNRWGTIKRCYLLLLDINFFIISIAVDRYECIVYITATSTKGTAQIWYFSLFDDTDDVREVADCQLLIVIGLRNFCLFFYPSVNTFGIVISLCTKFVCKKIRRKNKMIYWFCSANKESRFIIWSTLLNISPFSTNSFNKYNLLKHFNLFNSHFQFENLFSFSMNVLVLYRTAHRRYYCVFDKCNWNCGSWYVFHVPINRCTLPSALLNTRMQKITKHNRNYTKKKRTYKTHTNK